MQKSTENVAKSLKFCTLTGNRERRIERRCLDSAGLLRALSSVRMYECMYLCMYQFVFVVCRSISVGSQQTPANNRRTTTSARLRLDHDDITWLDRYGGGIVRRIKRYTWASEQLHGIIYWTVITGCALAPAHAPRSPVLKATGLVNGNFRLLHRIHTLTSSCKISSKSVKRLQRYGDLTVFKMAAVRHLGFVKFETFNRRYG